MRRTEVRGVDDGTDHRRCDTILRVLTGDGGRKTAIEFIDMACPQGTSLPPFNYA
jgi:hypothetical protein